MDANQDHTFKLKRIYVESRLPEELSGLQELAYNLWWCWNKDAIGLFEYLDPKIWKSVNYNPVALLEELSFERVNELKADKGFLAQLKKVEKQFSDYMAVPTPKDSPKIAYFCMEYGLHISLRLYSGGLGVLAGDFMKEASDSNVRMSGIGLLYRNGYFQQSLTLHGDQVTNIPPQKFTLLPVSPTRKENGDWLKVSVDCSGKVVHAKIWQLKVGRISIYLLDTDIDENEWEERNLTSQLYGGDREYRLRQELLLGVGGIRALKELEIEPDIYHCNEGHAAFMGLERMRNLMQHNNLSVKDAMEVVRSSSLFTTHTPVPAGHDYFDEDLLKRYFYDCLQDIDLGWDQFMAMGKINPHDGGERFSMSHLAIRLSQEVNGVSKLHGTVSQKMFSVLYPGYHANELHLSYVTNSVHYPTWIAKEWVDLHTKTFGEKFKLDQSNKAYWKKIHKVPASQIMEIRQELKSRLLTFVKKKLREDLTRRGENPRAIFEVLKSIKKDALVIGFARRFATYKRAKLLFKNVERLAEIVNDKDRPVIFLYSGKAHPADEGGQGLIKEIINISKRWEFTGKVIFLENYNMEIARLMVQGVDVWLNTPTRPLEASGTSGMKAAMNGVINFSVLDGWWAEGYRENSGWALPLERTYEDQDLQNELDAETVYNIMETEVIPAYFERDNNGIPQKWVSYIKNLMADVVPEFTMKRMMDDYFDRFYNKLYKRSKAIHKSNFELASKLTSWKDYITRHWKSVKVLEMDVFDTDNFPLELGEQFTATIKLDINDFSAEDLGIELVFFKRIEDDELDLKRTKELDLVEQNGNIATYSCTYVVNNVGVYEYGFRLFPKNELLPHRQDFNLVRWL